MTLQPVRDTARGELCILVVDDDIESRHLLALRLRSSGHSVHEAASAEEALRLMGSPITFDAVITDVEMPGEMNGIMLAEHIRVASPAIQIIVVSGLSVSDEINRRGMAFFHKPYTFESLLQNLKTRDHDDLCQKLSQPAADSDPR